jgi:hypothetical protein
MRWATLALVIVGGLLFAAFLYADTVSFYATGMAPASGATSVSGTENSAVVVITPASKRNTLLLAAVQNYDAANPKVAMVFDAAALPANGAIPRAACALAAAPGAANPSQCSLSLPGDGTGVGNGIVIACSTTGKTLTVDVTSGGNCYFQVAYR